MAREDLPVEEKRGIITYEESIASLWELSSYQTAICSVFSNLLLV